MSILTLTEAFSVTGTSASEKATLIALATLSANDGSAQASYSMLAQRSNLSRSTVIRAMKRLQALGLLRVTKQVLYGSMNMPNVYLVLPAKGVPVEVPEKAKRTLNPSSSLTPPSSTMTPPSSTVTPSIYISKEHNKKIDTFTFAGMNPAVENQLVNGESGMGMKGKVSVQAVLDAQEEAKSFSEIEEKYAGQEVLATSELDALWRALRIAQTGGSTFVPGLTVKHRGMLLATHKRAGKAFLPSLVCAFRNWGGFCTYAEVHEGAFKCPTVPSPQFVLKFVDSLVNYYLKYGAPGAENVQSKSTGKVTIPKSIYGAG